MEFSKQEYWSGLPFPTPGDLPHPGIEPLSPTLADGFFTPVSPGKFLDPLKATGDVCDMWQIGFITSWRPTLTVQYWTLEAIY